MRQARSLITSSPLQRKYLGVIALSMLLPTVIMLGCLYHLIFYLMANEMVFPEAIASTLIPVIDRVNWALLITMPLGGLFLLWLGLVVSHRFAGPIERIDRELDRILAGDRNHRIRVRKGDDWEAIVVKINRLIDQSQ